MIMISYYKDLHGQYTISYLKTGKYDIYQCMKFHLEEWEVGQYMGGN